MAISLDVVTRLNDRSARGAASEAQRYFDQASSQAGKNFDRNLSAGFDKGAQSAQKASATMERAFNTAANAAGRVRVEQEKYNALIERGGASQAQLVQHTERLATARRAEASATRQAVIALQNMNDSARTAQMSFQGMASTLSVIGGAARSPATLAALVPVLASVGNAAVTASGSLLLLPGVIGAAGAAFGTLKLATTGFSDAIENMSDPEKFAESLRSLSPSAREAATSIRNLMPELTQLKNATQNALFANIGPQLQQMSAALLPQIQQMTTSVASSFNQMFMGATNTLMNSPAFSGMMANIAMGFQNLAPAASSLTTAFTQLMAVGADFLPDLAQGASNAAQSFANFMTEASRSGQLHQWIQDGIDVMKMLGDAVVAAAQMFSALGADGKTTMSDIVQGVENVSLAVRIVTGDLQAWNEVFPSIGELARRTFEDIARTIDTMLLDPMREAIKVANMIPGVNIPNIPEIAQQGGPLQGGGGSFGGPAGAPGIAGGPLGGFTGGGLGGGAGMPYGSGGVAGRGIGDISQWSGNPINNGTGARGGSATTGTPMPSVAYSGDPMSLLQGYNVDASLYSAAGTVLDSRHRHAQAEAELNALLESNTATAAQIQDKRNDVARADREAYEAELRLNEAKQSSTEAFANSMKDASSAMGEIGVALDKDLGISKGLAGMADNLVRFLGNLAMAPVMGMLKGVQAGQGFQPGSAGKGIFGALAGTGALGSQFLMTPGTTGQTSAAGTFSGGGYGAYPGDTALLANVPAGRYTQEQRGDLTQGLADCSSAVEDLVNLMDGRPTGGASMYTGNAAEWLAARGFQPGMGGPGDMRVGYNSNHMQATLPGGTNFNWGSDASAARGGVGGTGAFDPAFTDHWFRPAGAAPTPSAIGPAPIGGGRGPGWGGPTGLPAPGSLPGGGSALPGTGMPRGLGGPGAGPGVGAAAGAPNSAMKTQAYSNPVGGEGFAGLGGLPLAAIQGAIGAAGGMGSMFGGQAGAAVAQMGMELANRAVAFGGQAASIGVSGLMETFLPSGDSPESSIGNSWLGRIAGGLAGAAPALPNLAGQAAPPDKKPEGQQPGQPGQGEGANGEQVGVKIENYNVTRGEDRAGQDLARHQGAAQTAGKMPWGGGG